MLKRTASKRVVTFQVAWRMDFDDAQMQALRAAVDRYGGFLGLSARVQVEAG